MLMRAILTVCFLLVLTPAAGFSFSVVALKAKDLPPYDQALEGFKSVVRGLKLDLSLMDEGVSEAELQAEVKALNPDLVLCLGTESFERACSIPGVPKVFCLVTASKVESLAQRTNIYGVIIDMPCLAQFKILAEAFPGRKRIGVLYDPQFSSGIIARAREAAGATGLELVATPVSSVKEVPAALDSLKGRIDLLWSIFDATAYGPETIKYILLATLKKDIPFIGFSPQLAKAGAVMSIYGDFEDMGRQAGSLARKIFDHEAVPRAIVEPQLVRIAVNSKVAEALGISFSPAFLKDVDQTF